MDFKALLSKGIEYRASDIHLSCKNPAIFRVHGDMEPINPETILTAEDLSAVFNIIMTDKMKAEYKEKLEIDFAVQIEGERYRVNAFNTLNGPACCLRLISSKVVSIETLNLPRSIHNFLTMDKGLVLVTGPTGSGKSTTITALLDAINRHQAKHIITIEDPVEFVHKSQKSLINQREIGVHSHSFAAALKSALREDPDIILVGELRDLETIHLALTAAETGHIVFATMHTSSAPKSVDRIIDAFPAEDKAMVRVMLSTALAGVVSQTLIKNKLGNGRVPAFEIMINTPSVANMIRENKIPQLRSIIQLNAKLGMRLMEDSIQQLANEGLIAPVHVQGENTDNQELSIEQLTEFKQRKNDQF